MFMSLTTLPNGMRSATPYVRPDTGLIIESLAS
jgi:hypothetical protein